jgi:hypothetical protein
MTETKIRVERPTVVLHTRPALEMDEEQFFDDNVSGDPILPGFVLDLMPIWEPGF